MFIMFLDENSRKYFGVKWKGWYFVCKGFIFNLTFQRIQVYYQELNTLKRFVSAFPL